MTKNIKENNYKEKSKCNRKQHYTNYFLDTPQLGYINRAFSEREVSSSTNPTRAGHGLAAAVRDLSETIWHETHNQYRILDIGGSITRNGGEKGFPTYNIVLSQKDLVRGLREESLNKEYTIMLKEYIKLQEEIDEKQYEIAQQSDEFDFTNDDEDLEHLEEIEKVELRNITIEQATKQLYFYGKQLAKFKKIYRACHYESLENKFEWLLFNHSIYDIKPQQVFDYMVHFGAKKATAFINKWEEGQYIYANTIECCMVTQLHTGKRLFAQKDSEYTTYYAHEQDPRTYAVPGTFTQLARRKNSNKNDKYFPENNYDNKMLCLSWETRVVREDLIEVEFSLTRAYSNSKTGTIQESQCSAMEEKFYQVVYQDPRTGRTEKYKTHYQAPAYFQNRVDTLLIRHFAKKIMPGRSEIFSTTQEIVAEENRKILLTENNKTLSVNMTKEQMLDVTIHSASEFATYLRIVRSARDDESKMIMFINWLTYWILPSSVVWFFNILIHYYFYAELETIKRTEYYNVELHTRYAKLVNNEHNEQSAIGKSYDIDGELDSFWQQYFGWCDLDFAAYGKLLSNMPTREEAIAQLKATYKKTTGCGISFYNNSIEGLNYIRPAIVKLGDLVIDVTGVSTSYQVYVAYKLNKYFAKVVRDHRPKNTTIEYEFNGVELPKFEVIKVQKPPVQFEHVQKFSIKNLMFNDDDTIEFNFGTQSTKTAQQDVQDWLLNLSKRNDLQNNDSTFISGAAGSLFCKLHRPKFTFASPIEYCQRWINSKPKQEHELMYRELDEFQSSLQDASIFLKLEHLFKKFNDPQFVKAHTVTHFDKVCNMVLTMFAEDFKAQLDRVLQRFNIKYTDGTPTFELEHLAPKRGQKYFESDLTAQDAKQGSATVLEFIRFYDLVGAPQDLTTMLFSTYTHTSRQSKTKTKIQNGTLKPTGGPDTGINNLLNNLFICQDLLFSQYHVYSQLLGDDLKSIVDDLFDIPAFIAHANKFGTEMKPEIRTYPEFCSNVTYELPNGLCKLVPKTEKILNTIFSARLSYENGRVDKTKFASTLLNFATMYEHDPVNTWSKKILLGNNYKNKEYNMATVPLFKNPESIWPACEALAAHSVYNTQPEFQVNLLWNVSNEIKDCIMKYFLFQ